MNKRDIKSIAIKFRRGFLCNRPSDDMCVAVCTALQSYLSFLGYNLSLEIVDFPLTEHAWLRFADGDILDPTADQFSGPTVKLPKVYLGPVPPIYKMWMAKAKVG